MRKEYRESHFMNGSSACDSYKADELLEKRRHELSLGIARVSAIWWAAIGWRFGGWRFGGCDLVAARCVISSIKPSTLC